jgi:hypothetical protein
LTLISMRDYQNTAKRMAAIIRFLCGKSRPFGIRRRPGVLAIAQDSLHFEQIQSMP